MAPPPPLLLPVKRLLESDDAHRLGVRVLAQPGGQQPVRGLPGGPAQLGDARARAAPWPVLQPPPGRVVGERMRHKRSLLVIQPGQQGHRGRTHLAGQGIRPHLLGISARSAPSWRASGRIIASRAEGSGVAWKNEASTASTAVTARMASSPPRSVTRSLLARVSAGSTVRAMRPLASSLRSTSEVIFTSVPACRATLS